MLRRLNAAGVDTEGALARFVGNEELYLSFLKKLSEYLKFDEIYEALKQEDGDRFYMLVHQLDGAAGNLGIESVYDSCEAIFIEFRSSGFKQISKLEALVQEAELESRQISSLVAQWSSQGKGE